jgi:RNA-directed DNA polymerase
MFGIESVHSYDSIISVENLLEAWREFIQGKRGRKDVQIFHMNLMDNILQLHQDLIDKIYRHGTYEAFTISDPKPRNIHKATVRDRLLHHAIYRQLYLLYDDLFVHDSFSCRNNKGTHKALDRFTKMARQVSVNHAKTVWVLKCDVQKFFASIDHEVLFSILTKRIRDLRMVDLLKEIVGSFNSGQIGKGLPLGNLTSQLLVNIYLDEFDQYVKRQLKIKNYIRYADDYVLLSRDRNELVKTLSYMIVFLREELKLKLHSDKVSISTFASGVDFLGWVHLPYTRVLRTITKHRMLRNCVGLDRNSATVRSYRGLLKYGDTYELHHLIS